MTLILFYCPSFSSFSSSSSSSSSSPRSSCPSSSSLSQLREKGLQVGKPTTFNVQFNGAQGHLDARVVAPSGAEDEAALMEVEKGHYAIRIVPKEKGTHQAVD